MNKIIFIDRDGVINKDPGGWTEYSYITRWEDFHFLPGAKEALKKLSDFGYEIIIISNQAGVGKGYYTESELKCITKKMLAEIEAYGGRIKKAYYCIHQDTDNCDCRKPKDGLFRKAEKELGIKVKDSYFIGDGQMDVEAAAGCGLKSILVLSGKTSLEDMRSWDIQPDFIFDNLPEAAEFVIKSDKGRGGIGMEGDR